MNDEAINECDRWRRVLSAQLPDAALHVVEESPSTQDLCRRLVAEQGSPLTGPLLVTCLRQTAGRGRLGRQWLDDEGQGAALTIALRLPEPGSSTPLPLLPIRVGVALCEAMEAWVSPAARIAIRWPNDIVIDEAERKIAGILIETAADGMTCIGAGININQHTFPAPIAGRAVSLCMSTPDTHCEIDRIEVIARAVHCILDWINPVQHRDDEVREAFARRNILRNTIRTFTCNGKSYSGRISDLDPAGHIVLVNEHGESHRLPAATTSLAPSTTPPSAAAILMPCSDTASPSDRSLSC